MCNCWLAFSVFHCGFLEKIEPHWWNYLVWTADWREEHNTPDTKSTLIIFLSTIAVILWFLNWRQLLLYFWLQEFISLFIAHSLCSSDKPPEKKTFWGSYVHWYVFSCYMDQSSNTELLLKKAYRLKQIEQICVIVLTRCFYSFTIIIFKDSY